MLWENRFLWQPKPKTMDDDLDRLLDDFEKSFRAPEKTKRNRSFNNEEPGSLIKNKHDNTKCIPPYLSGDESGRERICSSLKCIKCDFVVVRILSAKWLPETNYLFLRSSMPDEWKLTESTEQCAGAAAYACQCTHFTAQVLQAINDVKPTINWICRGHPN